MKWKVPTVLVLSLITVLVMTLSHCNSDTSTALEPAGEEGPRYLNHNDTVAYLGIDACRQCHAEIYQTFIHTGMGSSFGVADTHKSIASIGSNSLLHDPNLKLTYHPYWEGDSLYLQEFRLHDSGDTLYQFIQAIDYVVGSGQHTNSHIIEQNGYLTQAPFTWYAQKQQLDLPPGFEGGNNSRFSRKIGLECTSCHNSIPEAFVKGSINKYAKVPMAIDCERCHGPGELHVKRVSSGQLVDTARDTDYSIVNVKKLPADLQFEVCQRCHLQGNTVLQPGKSFLDFKPGMKLSEVMEVYLPRYSNADDEFIMASHIDRFRQSECVIQGAEGFNCISCHNPHITVKETKIEKFNSTCGNCHRGAPAHECTEEESKLRAANFNCVSCHMPASGSTDIPHVSVHDHKIKIPGRVVDTSGLREFLGLVAVNNPKPAPRNKAVAYLQQFERFEAKDWYLDSALFFLQKAGDPSRHLNQWLQYYFLKQQPAEVVALVERIGQSEVLQKLNKVSYDNEDGWAAYRIGESYQQRGKSSKAMLFYQRAVELVPHAPDFRLKLANSLQQLGRHNEALTAYRAILKEQPYHAEALNNLGFYYLQQKEFKRADRYFRKALSRNPDYELAWLNLANSLLLQDNNEEALKALKEALRINPQNERARQALSYLKKRN